MTEDIHVDEADRTEFIVTKDTSGNIALINVVDYSTVSCGCSPGYLEAYTLTVMTAHCPVLASRCMTFKLLVIYSAPYDVCVL